MANKSKVTHMYPLPGSFEERLKARIAQAAAASEAFAQTSMACPSKIFDNGCAKMTHECCWYMCPKGNA